MHIASQLGPALDQLVARYRRAETDVDAITAGLRAVDAMTLDDLCDHQRGRSAVHCRWCIGYTAAAAAVMALRR